MKLRNGRKKARNKLLAGNRLRMEAKVHTRSGHVLKRVRFTMRQCADYFVALKTMDAWQATAWALRRYPYWPHVKPTRRARES